MAATATTAAAGDKRQCKELPDSARERCETRVEAKCSSLEKYWDRRRCEDEIARKSDPCATPAWERACKQAKKQIHVCKRPGAQKTLAIWAERASSLPAARRDVEQFASKWEQCLGRRPEGCNVHEDDVRKCEQAPKDYARWWKKLVAAQKQRSEIVLRRAEQFRKKGDVTELGHRIRELEDELKDIAAYVSAAGKLAFLGATGDELDDVEREVKAERGRLNQTIAKRLSSARCPRSKFRKRGLERRLKAVAQKSGYKPARLSLEGPPRSSRTGPRERTLVQDVDAHVCQKPEKKSAERCRIIGITFRREKPDGGRWSQWHPMMGQVEWMLCKNLRK